MHEISSNSIRSYNFTAIQNTLNFDILKNIADYSSFNTKQVLSITSQHFKEIVGKMDLKTICENAAAENNLRVLKWARANGAPWGETCMMAARKGNLELLKWARANEAPWDDIQISTAAARSGQLEVLKWTRANGAPWGIRICSYAARGGHLEVLQWICKNGAVWSDCTCINATFGGHLEVLKWARANGAPWDRDTIRMHATPEIHEWLNDNP